MTTLFGLAALGFLLGIRHALEADHVAAVATLSTRSASLAESVRLGAIWGLGHSLVLFGVGSIALLAGAVVPERLAALLELGVGVMLVALGMDLLRRLVRQRFHVHAHWHADGTTHFHGHTHALVSGHDHEHLRARALLVGIVHGMAGSAALVLLASTRAPSMVDGLVSIAVFGLGSVGGMALLTAVMTLPLRATRDVTWIHEALQIVLGLATAGLGLVLVYECGARIV